MNAVSERGHDGHHTAESYVKESANCSRFAFILRLNLVSEIGVWKIQGMGRRGICTVQLSDEICHVKSAD